MSEDTVNDLANQMRAAGVKVGMVFNNGFEYNSRELNTSDESINELDDKEIGIVRGNPDFKTQTGRPVGDYVNKRAAAPGCSLENAISEGPTNVSVIHSNGVPSIARRASNDPGQTPRPR